MSLSIVTSCIHHHNTADPRESTAECHIELYSARDHRDDGIWLQYQIGSIHWWRFLPYSVTNPTLDWMPLVMLNLILVSYNLLTLRWCAYRKSFLMDNKDPICLVKNMSADDLVTERVHAAINSYCIDLICPEYSRKIRPTSWLLIPRLLASQSHHLTWYWLYRLNRCLSFMRKDFNNKHYLSVEKW